MTAETLVWVDGTPEWAALQSKPEIWDTVSTAAAPSAAVPSAAEPAHAVPGSASAPVAQTSAVAASHKAAAAAQQQPAKRKAAVVAKAAKTTTADAAPEDKALAAFQAEMSALGAVPAPGGEAGADVEDPIRAETPEPEDRRFQDDDGTWYIWDAVLRKFVEEVS